MSSIESIYIRSQNNDIPNSYISENYYEGIKAYYICLLINGGALIFFGALTAIATVVLTVTGWTEIYLVDCMHTIYLHSIIFISAFFAVICGILIFSANHSKGKSILIVTITALLIIVILFGVTLVKDGYLDSIKLIALNRTYNNPNFDSAWRLYENQNKCCGVVELICKFGVSRKFIDSCLDVIIYNTEVINRKIRLFTSMLLPSLMTCFFLGVIAMLCIPNINMKAERSHLCQIR